jgi:hypothetical protein
MNMRLLEPASTPPLDATRAAAEEEEAAAQAYLCGSGEGVTSSSIGKYGSI